MKSTIANREKTAIKLQKICNLYPDLRKDQIGGGNVRDIPDAALPAQRSLPLTKNATGRCPLNL
jgi:hypothetical protein